MGIKCNVHFDNKFIFPPVIAALFVFLSSCASSPVMFRSKDFIVYQLQKGETAATLAERYLGSAKKSWVVEDANENVPFHKDQLIHIPLVEENKGGLTQDGYQIVPVLCYHHFGKNCRSPLCIPDQVFDQQMKYLKDNGYRIITMAELYSFLQYRHAIPKKSVVITIDDGYRSVYDIAYPVLKRYGFSATLFIYTDFVGKGKSAITWDQLREMKAAGFDIGSHTLSHCDLTKKRKGEDDHDFESRIQKELLVSKQILDKKLDQDTIFFAFPYSSYNHKVLNLCEQTGYKVALTVKKGGNPFFSDPLVLRRNQTLQKDMKSFIGLLKTFHDVSLR